MLQGCCMLGQFIEVLAGTWMIYNLYQEFRREDRWSKAAWTAVCVILSILYVAAMWNSFISNISILLFSLESAAVYCIFLKVRLREAFLMEMLYLTSISFLKLPVLILESILYDKTLIDVNRGSRSIVECGWCILLASGILMAVWKKGFFEKYKESVRLLLSEHIRGLAAVTVLQWLLLSYNMWLGKQGFQTIDLVVNVLLVFCMSLFLHYLLLRTAYNRVQQDMNYLDLSQSLLQEQNEKLHEIYQKNSLRLHEHYRTLNYLYFCVTEGKLEEAKEFLRGHLEELDEEKREIWTGLPFLDFILNYKKQAIDKRNIAFRLELDVYEYPFEEAELGILLGNLLDNAVEACEKCEPGKREIYLRIRNVRCMFTLKLKNSSSKCPEIKEKRFITDKTDKHAHGMGVEQVRRIIDKYGGDISFQYSGAYFETKIMVSAEQNRP